LLVLALLVRFLVLLLFFAKNDLRWDLMLESEVRLIDCGGVVGEDAELVC